ncbi:hypothetical protein [Paludisphaera rhizosphaerae]|uniref:hypothetical protein n=1 Tax=Paludisphaera rhizosphaerae TaxID=2711216 RepID=UPI00197F3983|nr:hypothetical protein [Paludisphaera rhizosphaerae]
MSLRGCCGSGSRSPRPTRRPFLAFGGWLAPTVVLALLPKCPACLAAYVAIGTGVALSGAAATQLRTAIVAVCLGSIGFLVVRSLRRSRPSCAD